MAENDTCGMEKDGSESLKRAIRDVDQFAEEASNKKLKVEEPGEGGEQDGRAHGTTVVPRKKKCALLLSYCGAGYNGMQINPGVRTIEEELVNSLHKAEAISDDGKECMGKMSFQRCARTDKGVSAARQVVYMVPLGSILPTINENLPPEIRVIAMKRTTRGFDAKGNCSARTYEYLTPTYALAKDYQTMASYRVTAEKIEQLNEVLAKFLGTHNYHNFTSGKRFNDASANRYIMKFQCGKPFEKDDREFVVISVKGQSFMLHQIRKMIGLALAVVRGVAPLGTIELARREKKVDIPKAPAVGLVLDKVHFEGYNRRYGSDGIHETLEWEDYEEEIQQFKDKFIYKHIIDKEVKEHVMLRWLRTLPDHTYTDERMEEIQTKSVEASRTVQTTKPDNTSDVSCDPGGRGDVKPPIESGEKHDLHHTGETDDVNTSCNSGGGSGDVELPLEGGERDQLCNPRGSGDVKPLIEGGESNAQKPSMEVSEGGEFLNAELGERIKSSNVKQSAQGMRSGEIGGSSDVKQPLVEGGESDALELSIEDKQ